MILNNLKLLDQDEHLRVYHEQVWEKEIKFCKEFDLTLDLATSDVCAYIEDKLGNHIGLG